MPTWVSLESHTSLPLWLKMKSQSEVIWLWQSQPTLLSQVQLPWKSFVTLVAYLEASKLLGILENEYWLSLKALEPITCKRAQRSNLIWQVLTTHQHHHLSSLTSQLTLHLTLETLLLMRSNPLWISRLSKAFVRLLASSPQTTWESMHCPETTLLKWVP